MLVSIMGSTVPRARTLRQNDGLSTGKERRNVTAGKIWWKFQWKRLSDAFNQIAMRTGYKEKTSDAIQRSLGRFAQLRCPFWIKNLWCECTDYFNLTWDLIRTCNSREIQKRGCAPIKMKKKRLVWSLFTLNSPQLMFVKFLENLN